MALKVQVLESLEKILGRTSLLANRMDSTRIFIRGLPHKLTADEFERHFSKDMSITDARLIPHRRIGYVGYRTPTDAAKAVKNHNKSFLRMSRISVELARSPNKIEAELGKAPEDTRDVTSSTLRGPLPQTVGEDQKKRKSMNNEGTKFEEYLAVMQPPNKFIRLANERTATTRENIMTSTIDAESTFKEGRSDENNITAQNKRHLGILFDSSGPAVRGRGQSVPILREPSPADCHTLGTVQGEKLADQLKPAASDEEWRRSRTARTLDLVACGGGDEAALISTTSTSPAKTHLSVPSPEHAMVRRTPNASVQTDGRPPRRAQVENDLPTQEKEDLHTRRLFVRNLPYSVTEDEIRRVFECRNHGMIEEVHMPVDYRSGNGKGYAYVQYCDPVAAQHALDVLDGTAFQGRLLHIIPSTSKKQINMNDFTVSQLSIKKQHQVRRRSEAASSTFNWNSMFMNTDAVMSSMSDKLGIAKSELLDPTSSNAAIKQAHAETHVIQEAKDHFSAHGVNLDAFNEKDRGDTALLVKNLPFDLKAEDLRTLFSAYGNISKILVPPSGTIAIVEFDHAFHARSAFKELAYTKVKGSILFLEKAPRSLFTGGNPRVNEIVAKMPATDLKNQGGEQAAGDSSTLFVRNLSFSTTTARLRETFETIEGLLSAKVKTKPDPQKPRHFLSMGFGFLEFRTKQQAQAALSALDGYDLDGHRLQVRFSQKVINAAEERRKDGHIKRSNSKRTKIVIKNLPFEVSKKDVRSLFGPYGQLRSVRVPKKFNMSTRGFAFAEFVTPREAENAMSALGDTHLLGRRLVLEFATEEATDPEGEIANMQKRVGNQADKVALQRLTGTGRQKFNTGEADEL